MANNSPEQIAENTNNWAPAGQVAPAYWQDIMEETTDWLQNLVRYDTSNPPGNERPAAEYLHDLLAREGIESEIAGPLPHRSSLLARVRGRWQRRSASAPRLAP